MTRHHAIGLRVLVAVGLTGALFGGYVIAQQRAAAAMAGAANAWLDSLTDEQRDQATYPLDDAERTHWHFVPTSMFPRNGLPFKEMTAPQRDLANELLQASLSQAGFETVNGIRTLEQLLLDQQNASRGEAAGGLGTGPVLAVAPQGRGGGRGGFGIVRDPDQYFFTIFGEPSASGQWAMRVEGHHLSLHFAVDGAQMAVSSTPMFFGTNPAEVREGPHTGLRVLGAQEDAARALLASLSDEQRATAILDPEPPRDIVTGTDVEVDPVEPAGLIASTMTAEQRDLLMTVVDTFAATQTADVVAARMADIEAAGVENIGFAWFGATERGERYYYRIQGPTFLIEHNNTQNSGNHVHAVWRDFDGDFGRDLLAEHMAMFAH